MRALVWVAYLGLRTVSLCTRRAARIDPARLAFGAHLKCEEFGRWLVGG